MISTGTIRTKSLNNSYNGNPRYSVTLEFEDGSSITGKTASDYAFCYSMPKSGPAVCEWHTTRAGNVIFTDISKA